MCRHLTGCIYTSTTTVLLSTTCPRATVCKLLLFGDPLDMFYSASTKFQTSKLRVPLLAEWSSVRKLSVGSLNQKDYLPSQMEDSPLDSFKNN